MIPETSTTLLKNIGETEGSRWPEFVARYRPMMIAYLKSHFPAIDANDIVQETLIALSRALPRYRYSPDETGRFRNYLTGILRNKALKQSEYDHRETVARDSLRGEMTCSQSGGAQDDSNLWRESLVEIAMSQLLNDGKILDRSKQIFQRLAVDGMSPDDVAAAYGTSRNNVDKTKSRMISRLREIVRSLEKAGDD